MFTLGALATPEYLAWGTGTWNTPATIQVWLNSIALVETAVEFFRFVEQDLVRAAPSNTTWHARVLCRRFDRGPVCLRAGPPTMGFPMLKPPVASASDWEGQVAVSGNPEADAFAALVEVYALFGLPESAIPYSDGAAISVEQLRTV